MSHSDTATTPSTATADSNGLPASTGRTVAVMPAYNAALTLKQTVGDIPAGIVDEIILVDDCSPRQHRVRRAASWA